MHRPADRARGHTPQHGTAAAAAHEPRPGHGRLDLRQATLVADEERGEPAAVVGCAHPPSLAGGPIATNGGRPAGLTA